MKGKESTPKKPTRNQRISAQVDRLVAGGMPRRQAEKQVREAVKNDK